MTAPSPYVLAKRRNRYRGKLGYTLDELRIVVAAQRVAQIEANAAAMQRVAAGLPACVIPAGQCPLHMREAVSPARATASTTSTRSGGLSGCSTQSA